jgi:Zn finger protein HypA/HybF involved in hydrogenase expression
MSQVRIECPRCKNVFQAEEATLYECPKCGTNVKPKVSSTFESTQVLPQALRDYSL